MLKSASFFSCGSIFESPILRFGTWGPRRISVPSILHHVLHLTVDKDPGAFSMFWMGMSTPPQKWEQDDNDIHTRTYVYIYIYITDHKYTYI